MCAVTTVRCPCGLLLRVDLGGRAVCAACQRIILVHVDVLRPASKPAMAGKAAA